MAVPVISGPTSYRRVASLVVLSGSYCGARSISLSDTTSGSFHHWDWLACMSFNNVQRSTQIRNNFRNLVPLRAFPFCLVVVRLGSTTLVGIDQLSWRWPLGRLPTTSQTFEIVALGSEILLLLLLAGASVFG